MNMKTFLLTILLLSANGLFSQDLFLNHNDEEFSVGLKYGRGLKGQSFNLQANYIKTISYGYAFDISYEEDLKEAFTFTSFNQYRVSSGMFYNPFNYSKNNSLFLHLNSNIFVGYETLDTKIDINEPRVSSFIFGLNAGFELDWYVIPKTILFIGANQFYTYNSQIGNWHWEAVGGLRIKIN